MLTSNCTTSFAFGGSFGLYPFVMVVLLIVFLVFCSWLSCCKAPISKKIQEFLKLPFFLFMQVVRVLKEFTPLPNAIDKLPFSCVGCVCLLACCLPLLFPCFCKGGDKLEIHYPPFVFVFDFLILLHRWCNWLSLLLFLFVLANTSFVDLIIVHFWFFISLYCCKF